MSLTKKHALTAEQLRVLVGPRTQEVFDAINEAGEMSVAEVQAVLGFASKSIYYQIEKLLKAGLIVRGGGSARAATFRPVSAQIYMPDGFQGEEYEKLAAKAVSARLRSASRRFEAVAESSSQHPELVDWLSIRMEKAELTPAAFDSFKAKCYAALDEARQMSAGSDKTQSVRIVIVTTPEVADSRTDRPGT